MRMKSGFIALALVLSAGLAACGGSQVAVQVTDENPQGELQSQEDVVVDFLPYDRDSIFQALESQAAEPRPEIPDTLRSLYSEIIERQEEWRSAERQWQQWRDSLKALSSAMEGMNESGAEYKQMYSAFTDLEPKVQALNQQKNEAFQAFDSLQTRTLNFADSIQALRDTWAQTAYEGYIEITDSIVQARGREVVVDTTDAGGWVDVTLPGGQWWVHARTSRPFEEVYWNVPLDPAQTDTLRLTPDNAEIRLSL